MGAQEALGSMEENVNPGGGGTGQPFPHIKQFPFPGGMCPASLRFQERSR